MSIPKQVVTYNNKFAANGRSLVASDLTGIEQAVVIPALAEKDFLFAALAHLSRNHDHELRRTLVICVVNNRGPHITPSQIIKDNQDTIKCLHGLIEGMPCAAPEEKASAEDWHEIFRSSLRLAYIDASSSGREMPDKWGGVGAARKIGMDAALQIFDYKATGTRFIISLDADTFVEGNYLEAIRNFFIPGRKAALVKYAHERPKTAKERLAISTYEIFLRYYVLGLWYAGSPYAFHAVGSTIICTAEAYAAVGGMNRRDAAEDFYFLNKLAKYGEVGRIINTTVHPSARSSWRVPFGTGQRMVRFMEGGRDEFLLYDPRVFFVLKRWLDVIKAAPGGQVGDIMTQAGKIEPLLLSFLKQNNFPQSWERIRENVKDRDNLLRHFHFWFDGFKTMKLIHFLTDRGFPQLDMFSAVEKLLNEMRDRI